MHETIETVLQEHRDRLMLLPGVVGTAVGACRGRPCVRVYVLKKDAQTVRAIPRVLDSYPVCVEESGQFRAVD